MNRVCPVWSVIGSNRNSKYGPVYTPIFALSDLDAVMELIVVASTYQINRSWSLQL